MLVIADVWQIMGLLMIYQMEVYVSLLTKRCLMLVITGIRLYFYGGIKNDFEILEYANDVKKLLRLLICLHFNEVST